MCLTAIRYIVLAAVFLLTSLVGVAQKEDVHWFFGDSAYVDFSSGVPVAGSGPLWTGEGTSSISDTAGNLLFYSDGSTVWDRFNNVMPSGTGLGGNPSSTMSVLIVPQPCNPSLYNVFTTDAAENLGVGGLQYSQVDMSLNGGFGDVTTIKNVYLNGPTCEKVSAVKHCNDKDYWIVSHQYLNNAFYAYPLTTDGLGTPIISNIGLTPTTFWDMLGEMKFSNDGSKLAIAHHQSGFQLLDFDNITGVVSNPITLELGTQYYGVAFSPDDSRLYVTKYISGELWQYDLLAANIPASRVMVASVPGQIDGMQNGLDGKIYCARVFTPWLGVINNPNLLGLACNYVNDGFNISPNECIFGLPNFVVGNNVAEWCGKDQLICVGDTAIMDAGSAGSSYSWSTGETTQIISSATPGVYWVDITSSGGCVRRDTINITNTSTLVGLGNDTILQCNETLVLNATTASSTYRWQDGSVDSIFIVNSPGTYWVEVSNFCVTRDSIVVEFYLSAQANAGPDATICEEPHSLDANIPSAGTGTWSVISGSVDFSDVSDPATTITGLTVGSNILQWTVDPGYCPRAIDEVEIILTPPIDANAGEDVTIIEGQEVGLGASASGATPPYSFTWDFSSTLSDLTIPNPLADPTIIIIYLVSVMSSDGCVDQDVVVVSVNAELIIPTGFSPDNDGINDVWELVNIHLYPEVEVSVFNRWGNQLFFSKGYNEPWDGTYEGQVMPTASYYFVIDLNSVLVEQPITGIVSVIMPDG